jgi:putative sigma-54 modulation protein
MQITVTFKNVDSSEPLKSYVQEKLNRLDKFLDNPAEASAVLSVEKFRHSAEINISGDRLTIVGREETNDMYSAIDMAVEKLEKQIKRTKQKIREKRPGLRPKGKSAPGAQATFGEEEPDRQVIVNTIEYKPMDVEEAIMQMDLVGDSFLVFTNARTGNVNVLYRRNDGHYGLIEPRGR